MIIEELVWDEFNQNHIFKHGVTKVEIIEATDDIKLILRGKLGRVMVIGETVRGRLVTVILAKVEDRKYYLVTARDTSREERRKLNVSKK